jgi:hypothetical protein
MKRLLPLEHSLASTGGVMLAQTHARKCFRCSMNQAFLLQHVGIGLLF